MTPTHTTPKSPLTTTLLILLLTGAGLHATGCSSDSDGGAAADARGSGDGTTGDAAAGASDDDGCVHLANGPFADVTAATTDEPGDDADISAPHTAFRVALADVDVGHGGMVRYQATEDGEFIVSSDHTVNLAFATADGAPVTIEAHHVGEAPCDDVAATWVVDLSVGTYFLTITDARAATVSLVVAEGGEHVEEDATP